MPLLGVQVVIENPRKFFLEVFDGHFFLALSLASDSFALSIWRLMLSIVLS